MLLIHNGGRGFQAESTFHVFFYPRALREERGSSDGKFLLLLFFLLLFFLLFFFLLFHTSKFVFLPGQKKLKFCSYPAEKSSSFVPTRPKKAQVLFLPGRKSSSFVPTRPKKAQVLFLPGREKLKFLFLLGTENTVKWGGVWVRVESRGWLSARGPRNVAHIFVCQLEILPDFLGIWWSHCWVPNILFYLNKINTALNNLQ